MAKIDSTGCFHTDCTNIEISANGESSRVRIDFDVGNTTNGCAISFTNEEFQRFVSLCGKVPNPPVPSGTKIAKEIKVVDDI
jgi:hypothetical protein